ncbi:MAG: nucleotidyl transferase AbiEii/AbiGii toxin family protein [Pseudomonadota bacterium]
MIRSIRPERPLDATLLHVLRAVAEEAEIVGTDYMLVGATARDILVHHVFEVPAGRATYDVDFAVAVASWDQFERLKAGLASRPGFTTSDASKQRMYYRDAAADMDYPVDLVPFGGVANAEGEIVWPPDMAVVMNVVGYEEVLAAAEYVEFSAALISRVASLPGLAVLKLIAWSDRGPGNPKDAHDLLQLMSNYGSAGNQARLYDIEYALLEAADHDPDLAGACLLGKDVARLVKEETLNALNRLIDEKHEELARAMAGAIRHMDDAR